jgi:hypothetical protein
MMRDYIKVKDSSTLLRDQGSNAIVNDSKYEYENYMRLKRQREKENDKVNHLESEIDTLKSDVSEIKDLLKSFIEKLG